MPRPTHTPGNDPRSLEISRRWVGPDSRGAALAQRDYDLLASDYDPIVEAWGYRCPELAAELLRQRQPPPARILDAGCGTGLVGECLHAAGYNDVVGIDISESSLARAHERGCYRLLLQRDLDQPFALGGDRFDAATCIGVLTYVDELTVLRRLAGQVRPGGTLVFSHRQDRIEEAGLESRFAEWERLGIWQIRHVTPPLPYLPQHPDYADRILVRVFVCEIGETPAGEELR